MRPTRALRAGLLAGVVAGALLVAAAPASAQTAAECRSPGVTLSVSVVGSGSATAQEPLANCIGEIAPLTWNVLRICGFHCLHFHTPTEPAAVRLTPVGTNFWGWSANCTPRVDQPQSSCTVVTDTSKTVTGTFGPVPDTVAPTRPSGSATSTRYSVTLTWTPSVDDRWLGGYDVVRNGTLIARTPPGTTTFRADNLFCEEAYSFTIVAFDAVNRSASDPINERTGQCLQTGDTTAPNTILRSKPPRVTSRRTATFRWSASEDGVRYQCRLDRSRWASCRSGKRYRGLARRSHTFRVRAIDGAGNVDPTPATWRWRIR